MIRPLAGKSPLPGGFFSYNIHFISNFMNIYSSTLLIFPSKGV